MVVGVSRCGLMVWVLLVLVLGVACAWVVGSSGRANPCRGLGVLWWLAGGRLACGPGGAGCLWCWGSSFGCLWFCSCRCCTGCGRGCRCCGWVGGGRCVAGVGGAGDFVGEGAAGRAPCVGAAGGEGVVGDALVDGGVLTVPWGWDVATPGGGSRGHCWPVCWS